jgi:hypothetical protein
VWRPVSLAAQLGSRGRVTRGLDPQPSLLSQRSCISARRQYCARDAEHRFDAWDTDISRPAQAEPVPTTCSVPSKWANARTAVCAWTRRSAQRRSNTLRGGEHSLYGRDADTKLLGNLDLAHRRILRVDIARAALLSAGVREDELPRKRPKTEWNRSFASLREWWAIGRLARLQSRPRSMGR